MLSTDRCQPTLQGRSQDLHPPEDRANRGRLWSDPCSVSATSAPRGLGPSSPLGLVAPLPKEGLSPAVPPYTHQLPPAESLPAARTCPDIGDTATQTRQVCPMPLRFRDWCLFSCLELGTASQL